MILSLVGFVQASCINLLVQYVKPVMLVKLPGTFPHLPVITLLRIRTRLSVHICRILRHQSHFYGSKSIPFSSQ